MKIILRNLLLGLVTISSTLFAQIPNSGFENWTGNSPDKWLTNNSQDIVFVAPVTNAKSGEFAVKIETRTYEGFLETAFIASGAEGNGFPVSERYSDLNFYYKFDKTISTAYILAAIIFVKGEEVIGAGIQSITEPAGNFEYVSIPVSYFTNEIPDRALITISVTDIDSDPLASGSYAIIDDLSFNKLTDVKDGNSDLAGFTLEQNYPNPFNPNTRISWQSSTGGHQSLKVYDILGNEVATLVDEYKPAGSYEVNFNASELASGVYLYRLQAGAQVITKKMMLMK